MRGQTTGLGSGNSPATDNLITKTTGLAMAVTLEYVKAGDTAVDATCGTGRDTAALAEAVGADGSVHAFDIQPEALEQTAERLREAGLANAELHLQSFETMEECVPAESAAAVVFNLGYLPGGDHRITTTAEETLSGLAAALRTVRTDGIVTVVLYDGHEEGAAEKERVLEWAASLDPKRYHAAYVSLPNQRNHPPEILWITKKLSDRPEQLFID